MSQSEERRKHPRFQLNIPLSGEMQSGQRVSFISGDVSLGGIACHSTHHVPEMTKMDMHIDLPGTDGNSARIHAEGVVVRVEPPEPDPACSDYRVAMFFTHLSDDSRQALRRYLDEHARQAREKGSGS